VFQNIIAPYLGFNLVAIALYLLFAIPALMFLRNRMLDDTTKAVWVVAIVVTPVMGAVAFAILQPGAVPRR
jgi:hypothetical protein